MHSIHGYCPAAGIQARAQSPAGNYMDNHAQMGADRGLFSSGGIALDALVFFCAAFFAFCVQQGLWLGTVEGTYNPFKSDVEEYSGRLAYDAHPENFQRDPMYGGEHWTTSFFTLETWLGEKFPAGENYNWACMRQTGPSIVIFYIGFYLLGLYLFRNRAVAVLLMLAMGMPDDVGWGTFWGILSLPTVPRLLFDTALPWLLILAFASIKKLWLRPLVMLACGALSSAHAISALGMGGAIFAGYAFTRPEGCPLRRHFAWLFVCAVSFVCPLLPCFVTTMGGSKSISPEDARFFHEMFENNFRLRFGAPFADLGRFIWRYCFSRPLIPLAALGAWASRAYGGDRLRGIMNICLLWLLGLFLSGTCLAWLELSIASELGRISILHQMIRVTRFCVPVFYIIMACGLCACFQKWGPGVRAAVFSVLLITFIPVCYISLGHLTAYASYYVQHNLGVKNWFTEMFDRQVEREKARREAMLAVKRLVPPDEMVFSNTGDPAVRYLGLRSLGYTFTDGAHLFFRRDAAGCRRWLETSAELKRPGGYIEAWRKSPAQYLLTDHPDDERHLAGETIWRGKSHILVRKKAQE